jgi:hypothetical protein
MQGMGALHLHSMQRNDCARMMTEFYCLGTAVLLRPKFSLESKRHGEVAHAEKRTKTEALGFGAW